MSNTPESVLNSKYAWSDVAHQEPPKRPAAERVGDFNEVYGDYDEETAREQASRCILCPEPACVAGCPLASRIPEWLALTADGRFLEAAALAQAANGMPEICARVCPADVLCEGRCILDGKAEPVSISAIEQFLSDYALAHGAADVTPAPPNGWRVAVCGSGPAGLTCADELARRGYAVTVFDSAPAPGGLLVNGIPAFKLQKALVERRIGLLQQRGVVFRMGVTVGRDISLGELRAGFDAIFLGFGAQKARSLDVPGGKLEGVIQGLPFIIEKNTAVPLGIPAIDVAGKRVVVLGGGDTAMDCLRTALRCGAREAVCVYRREEADMPGSRREYQIALEEGARFVFRAAPVAVLGDAHGSVAGLRLLRTEPGPPDSDGRRTFATKPGTEFELRVESILLALGFAPAPLKQWEDFGCLATNASGRLVVDAHQMTNVPGVFAGGGLVRGASLVGYAVQDARKAAAQINDYVRARAGAREEVVAGGV